MDTNTTIGELIASSIANAIGENTGPTEPSGLPVGHAVLIRTVTHYHTGRLVSASTDWLVLDDAAWVTDTGRWADALDSGTLGEVEPFPSRAWVNRGAVIDLAVWPHELPREQK